MALTPGTRIGPYEVTGLLGEGGMEKVWRARHTALKRDDALKVLPEASASDPERLARFQREAQVLASLNHSNIAHVYGLEQSDGGQALVMELVEGPTLAGRLTQGAPLVRSFERLRNLFRDGERLVNRQGPGVVPFDHKYGRLNRCERRSTFPTRCTGASKAVPRAKAALQRS